MYTLMKRIFNSLIVLLILTQLSCTSQPDLDNTSDQPVSTGQIFLFGEAHGVAKIQEKEADIWGEFYQKGMRHLFIESSYYGAEFLNLWMKADNDEILLQLYEDFKGTPAYTQSTLDFYKRIKKDYPETVFHGTDIGHQFQSTGERYLNYLSQQGLENSENYTLALEAIDQGKKFYENGNWDYRENRMVENFIREFNQLQNVDVMGIYGSAHTSIGALDRSGKVPAMANQLHKIYGDHISTESLVYLTKDIEPIRTESIEVNGKTYVAHYFGRQDLTGFKDLEYRDVWRLEDAYSDFAEAPPVKDFLAYEDYPMLIDVSQVFVIEYKVKDRPLFRRYYRSDGTFWNNLPITQGFFVE